MKLVTLLVLLYAVKLTITMVCKIEKNQVTDSQKAVWRSFLEPITLVITLLNQAVAISSSKDFSIADYGKFTHVKYPWSFRLIIQDVNQELTSYMVGINDMFDQLSEDLKLFPGQIEELIQLFSDDELSNGRENYTQMMETGIQPLLESFERQIDRVITHIDTIPHQLAEVATIGRRRRRRAAPTGAVYILRECVKRCRQIVALMPRIKLFAWELSIRFANLRSHVNTMSEYGNGAFDANMTDRVGVKQILICSAFRINQDMLFIIEMATMYLRFHNKYGYVPNHLNVKAKTDYDGTLREIQKKAGEAEERIKAIPQELTDAYNTRVDEEVEMVAKILEKID